jgi:hypothetical protein
VKLLALLCPAIRTPIITELCQKVLDKNLNILIPQNGDDFITMVNILCFKTIRFPHKIMQAFVNLNYNKRKNLLEKGSKIENLLKLTVFIYSLSLLKFYIIWLQLILINLMII